MKPSPCYLTLNRHGTFYFRIVVPRPLRALFNDQREVRRTLQTDSERLARKRARQYAARYEAFFDKVACVLERDELGLTEADYEELIQLGLVPDTKPTLDFSSPIDESKPNEPILSLEESKALQRRAEVVQFLTGAPDRELPPESEQLAQQLLELSRCYPKAHDFRINLPRLRDELVLNSISTKRELAGTEIAQPQAKYINPSMAEWTLYQVWEHQLERDRADTSSRGGQANRSGSLEENKRFARVMTVLTQHKPVCQLSKWDWQGAYDAARKMKVGAEASLMPPTHIHDLLTDDPAQMVGDERTNAFIGVMKQIQQYANHLDLTTITPDKLLIEYVEKRESIRSRKGKAFSAEDVEAIFSGYIFRGELPTNRTKAYPFWFWIPLIGYFTGARTNEIAQLDTADVKVIEGHHCFDFCPDNPKAPEPKRIKTGEARQVPIHPRLIELGLLDYVKSQLDANQKKLFGDGLTYLPSRDADTDHNKEGWAKSASKFFNETPKGYLVSIGVHQPNDGKSLYSFRHTLETNLGNAKRDGKPIDQTITDAITGHRPETVAGRHYDDGATIEQKLAGLLLLPIPKAIEQLSSYQENFVERFGEVLIKSIATHRRKHRNQI